MTPKQNSPRVKAVPQIIASLDRNVKNNRLPPIIAHPHPSRHLLLLLCPPCQVTVEPDPAKLISENSSSGAEDIDIEN